jgi:hypothetical protein
MDDGSLLRGCDSFVLVGFEAGALAWVPALEAGLGIDWHISVARFTPAESRNDFALGFGGGDGGGEGLSEASARVVRRSRCLSDGSRRKLEGTK